MPKFIVYFIEINILQMNMIRAFFKKNTVKRAAITTTFTNIC